jgi:hypothetical protein
MYLFCRDIWFSARINGAEYFSNWIGGIDHRRRRAYASNKFGSSPKELVEFNGMNR